MSPPAGRHGVRNLLYARFGTPAASGMPAAMAENAHDMGRRFPALWGAYREHLLGLDGSRPLAAATVSNYRKICWDFQAFLEPKPWWKARPTDLRRFIDRPAPRSRTGVRAANTALQIGVAVKGLYAFAHRHGYTGKDLLAAFELPKGGQPRPRGFDPEELRAILAGADDDPRLSAIVWAAYAGGLRAAEIAGLRVEQIDLRHGWLDVTGKGGKRRLVPIHPRLRAALVRYLAGRPEAGPLIVSLRPPYGPLRPHTVTVYVSAYIHSLPDPHDPDRLLQGSCHDLRHSLVWHLLECAGEERLLTISRIVGHADTGTTEKVYGLRYTGRAKDVIGALLDPLEPTDPRQPSNRPATGSSQPRS